MNEVNEFIDHYYGYRVRQINFLAAIVMLVGLPFVGGIISFPVFVSIVAILILDFFAGLTSPKQLWINLANIVVAGVALVVFELMSVQGFAGQRFVFFGVNQFLALLFLFSIYYNTKTLRAMLVK